jgi:hypothetical protein
MNASDHVISIRHQSASFSLLAVAGLSLLASATTALAASYQVTIPGRWKNAVDYEYVGFHFQNSTVGSAISASQPFQIFSWTGSAWIAIAQFDGSSWDDSNVALSNGRAYLFGHSGSSSFTVTISGSYNSSSSTDVSISSGQYYSFANPYYYSSYMHCASYLSSGMDFSPVNGDIVLLWDTDAQTWYSPTQYIADWDEWTGPFGGTGTSPSINVTKGYMILPASSRTWTVPSSAGTCN